MRRMLRFMPFTKIAAAAVLALAFAAPAAAQEAAGIFGKGRTQLFVSGGSGSAFGNNYFVLGAGLTYYALNGVGVGVALERWSGSDPTVTKLTGSLQYVFYQLRAVKPYLGGFYRRTYISGESSLDSIGGRAGVYIRAGQNAYVGLGGVYESYQDCTESVYRKCNSTYPEVSFTFAF